jgi:hypothetical protein
MYHALKHTDIIDFCFYELCHSETFEATSVRLLKVLTFDIKMAKFCVEIISLINLIF